MCTLNIRLQPNDTFFNNECYYVNIYRQIGFTILSSAHNIVRV